MRLRNTAGRITAPSATPRKRYLPRALWRAIAVLLLGAAVVAALIVSASWLRGEGMIVGELTSVNPITQMRVKKVLVECLQPVRHGQVLARLENELTMETVRQQIDQLTIELDQARSSVEAAANQAAAARQLHDARIAVRGQLQLVLDAQSRLLDQHHIASLAWQKSKSDVVRAEAEAQAARYVYETKLEDRRRAQIRARLIEKLIESLRSSPELMGSVDLLAPKDGYLTQCDARAGEVVDASTALFRIFNPHDAFAVVFLDPGDAERRDVGDALEIEIDGIHGSVHGVITGFYPQFSALPDALTRYFWQQERWSSFAPVRVQLDGLDDAQRARLRASARVYVSAWDLPDSGLTGSLVRMLRIECGMAAARSLLARLGRETQRYWPVAQANERDTVAAQREAAPQ